MAPPPKPPRGTKGKLQDWLDAEHPAEIGRAQWDALRRDLAPVSGTYLRKLLRETGLPLAPLVEGVRQEDFENLARTLNALLAEYERGDTARRTEVRRMVIEAKDHARWAARKPEKKALKEEMALWLLTWLENPPLFPEWARLRRQVLETKSAG